MQGLFDGLAQEGFKKDGNLDVISSHAQGEIANIPMLVQNFMSQGVDLIITLTTPCLSAACAVARNTRIVYNSSEANSVKVISVGRDMFRKQGISLEEVTVTNTSEVFQAAQVACYRNVQAMWV